MAQRKIKANCQVQVQLSPEPTNGKDKNAIAIDLKNKYFANFIIAFSVRLVGSWPAIWNQSGRSDYGAMTNNISIISGDLALVIGYPNFCNQTPICTSCK